MAADGPEGAAAAGTILCERRGVIGTITINNPMRHNAVSQDMWQAIADSAAALDANPAVRVITIQGAGRRAFAAGADIARFETDRAAARPVTREGGAFNAACAALHGATKPTIAIIRGWCLGGGMALAVSCDLRIAADDAQFGIPAARLSIGYGVEGLRHIVELVGLAATREIMFTARRYRAPEALRMGLINQLIPAAELDAFAADYVATIAANAPLTIAAAKSALAELARDPDARNWTATEALIARCSGSADHIEGARAFLEKRPPVFIGQ